MNLLGTLGDERLLNISRFVIQALPADSPEDVTNGRDKQELAAEFGFRTVVELNKTAKTLFDYWKKALFHAKKPAIVKADFEEIGVSSDGADRIAEMWLEEGARAISKARSLSRNGIPEVNDIRWTLNLERATQVDGQKREPHVNLQFVSKHQKQCVRLTYDELKQLHTEMKEVQRNIDLIFK